MHVSNGCAKLPQSAQNKVEQNRLGDEICIAARAAFSRFDSSLKTCVEFGR
jgi:hypothetical protein